MFICGFSGARLRAVLIVHQTNTKKHLFLTKGKLLFPLMATERPCSQIIFKCGWQNDSPLLDEAVYFELGLLSLFKKVEAVCNAYNSSYPGGRIRQSEASRDKYKCV